MALIVVAAWLASTGVPRDRAKAAMRRLMPVMPAVAAAIGLAYLASLLVPEARPFVVLHQAPLFAYASDPGFPSDHVSVGMALLAAGVQARVRITAGVLVVAVGFARVLAGVHWLDDIAAAAVLGLAVAWISVTMWTTLIESKLHNGPLP